jgi:hypothetical protein
MNMNTLFSTGKRADKKVDPKNKNTEFYQGNGLAYDTPESAAGASGGDAMEDIVN